MTVLLVSLVFLFGLIIGSFLNVVVLRYNTGRSLQGRSACFSCKTVLTWYELMPVGSYIMQAGRCRHCGSVLSPQYPLVELLTGALFVGIFLKLYEGALQLSHLLQFGFYAAVTGLLIAVLVYDLHHKIIPNGLVYAAALIAFGALFVNFETLTFAVPAISDLLAGPVLAAPFALLWLVSAGRWMGLGDAKLGLVMGWLLGLTAGTTAVLLSFWTGAVLSLALILTARLSGRLSGGNSLLLYHLPALTMKSEVPFAPFLIVSLWFVFFSGFDLFVYLGFF